MKVVGFLDHNHDIQWGLVADSTLEWQDFGWVHHNGLLVWADQLCSPWPTPNRNLVIPYRLSDWDQMIDNILNTK
jgi:hypothetical protein